MDGSSQGRALCGWKTLRTAVPRVVMDPNGEQRQNDRPCRPGLSAASLERVGGGGGAAPLHFGKLLQNDKFSDRYFNQLNRTFWGWGFEEAGECGRFKLSGLKCGAKVKTCVS